MAKIKSNDGRIHVAEPLHVNSSPAGKLTPDVVKHWAPKLDLISTNPGKLQGQESLIEQFTDIMIYNKAFGDNDGSLAEAMYSHHWTGSALQRKANKNYNPPVNIMQPDGPWLQHDIATLQVLAHKYPWIKGFFNDTARAAYDIGGPPVVPGSHNVDTRTSWNARGKKKLDAVNAAIPMPWECLNGLQADTSKAFTPCIGMVEAAFGLLDHTFPNPAAFAQLADLVWQVQSIGWTPWVYVKMNTTFGSQEWLQARRFTLTASMILDRGSLLYCLGGKEQTPPSWSTGELDNSMYDPGLGIPTQSPVADWRGYQDASGALVKEYESGYVICNPTLAGVNVRLLNGFTVAVPPQDGSIMVEQVSWKEIK